MAEQCFGKAAALAPEFAFAAGNHALALFQLGQTDSAVRQMRCDFSGSTNQMESSAALLVCRPMTSYRCIVEHARR